MGTYVYKVTKELKTMPDGLVANVMKFAYKPYSFWDDQASNQMRFSSQCWRADKLVQSDEFTGRVVMEGDGPLSKDWVLFPQELIDRGDGTLDDYDLELLLQEKKSKKRAERSKKYVETKVQIYRQDLSNLDNQLKYEKDRTKFIDLKQVHVADIVIEHSEDALLSKVLEETWKATENETYDHLSAGWIAGDHVTWCKSLQQYRSNMPGDHYFINSTLFRVAPFGFDQLHVDGMKMTWIEPDYCKPSELK